MNNTFRQLETDDIVIYTEHTYSNQIQNKCIDIFDSLVQKGEIKGAFEDNKWMAYSGLKQFGLSFAINDTLFNKHIGKELGITKDTMISMIKCYAISCTGIYIYTTIVKYKVNVVKRFVESYTDKNYKVKQEDVTTIEDFLGFINTPEQLIESIVENIRLLKNNDKSQRQLKPVINYMVIENEINSLNNREMDEEAFRKWFPIFFWVNITFILPLRATEMLVTPLKCIVRKDNKVFLNIRRTMLKKGLRKVYYDVDRDYQIFEYEIPDTPAVSIIEKYINITSQQDRRFLFQYNEYMVNDMLSLAAFNNLIAVFMEEHIIGNHRYDFARYATNIKEFEVVTAGDSRPIAMANLYFQNAGEDICRQLAGHININTSSGYYSNISETILNSSIVQLQKIINLQAQDMTDDYKTSSNVALNMDVSICTSRKREFDDVNLDDCIEQGHLEDCIGCKYYMPSQKELDEFLEKQQEKANESAKRVIDFMNNIASTKNKEMTLEEVFLQVQTDATRYRMGCKIKTEEARKEWQKLKSSQKTFC